MQSTTRYTVCHQKLANFLVGQHKIGWWVFWSCLATVLANFYRPMTSALVGALSIHSIDETLLMSSWSAADVKWGMWCVNIFINNDSTPDRNKVPTATLCFQGCGMQWFTSRGHGLGLEVPWGHFKKSLALDVKSLALALILDLKSLTIGCRIITLLFVIFQWNELENLNKKRLHLHHRKRYCVGLSCMALT